MEAVGMKHFQAGKLKVEIHPDRKAAARAAAEAAARAFKEQARENQPLSAIFATGASQMDMLEALTSMTGLPWESMRGFHMDEYVGIAPDHPASFRRYLRERLTSKVPIKEFLEIDGSAPDPEKTGRHYADMLRAADPQVCLLGIGENGHLAFNDPGVADFRDPLDVKTVVLDAACRRQQTAEGCFAAWKRFPMRLSR